MFAVGCWWLLVAVGGCWCLMVVVGGSYPCHIIKVTKDFKHISTLAVRALGGYYGRAQQ